jgi:hypothetical protein
MLVKNIHPLPVKRDDQLALRQIGDRHHLIAIRVKKVREATRERVVLVDPSAIGAYPQSGVGILEKANDCPLAQPIVII